MISAAKLLAVLYHYLFHYGRHHLHPHNVAVISWEILFLHWTIIWYTKGIQNVSWTIQNNHRPIWISFTWAVHDGEIAVRPLNVLNWRSKVSVRFHHRKSGVIDCWIFANYRFVSAIALSNWSIWTNGWILYMMILTPESLLLRGFFEYQRRSFAAKCASMAPISVFQKLMLCRTSIRAFVCNKME